MIHWTAKFDDGSVIRKTGFIGRAIRSKPGLLSVILNYGGKDFGMNLARLTAVTIGIEGDLKDGSLASSVITVYPNGSYRVQTLNVELLN